MTRNNKYQCKVEVADLHLFGISAQTTTTTTAITKKEKKNILSGDGKGVNGSVITPESGSKTFWPVTTKQSRHLIREWMSLKGQELPLVFNSSYTCGSSRRTGILSPVT